jgi:hypothetical protein
MVELSVQVIVVPVEASVSKFSVNGVPNDVILPLFVSADDRGIRTGTTVATKSIAIDMYPMRRLLRAKDWKVLRRAEPRGLKLLTIRINYLLQKTELISIVV